MEESSAGPGHCFALCRGWMNVMVFVSGGGGKGRKLVRDCSLLTSTLLAR